MLLFVQFAAEMLMWLIAGCFLRLEWEYYVIHGAIVLNILDNVWAIILKFKITTYSAFTASVTLRFLAKGLYTYKLSINFAIVIS